jgi:hypothetical protein
VKNIKNTQTHEARRVSDDKAERLVRTGRWAYCPKKEKAEDGTLRKTVTPKE